MAPLSGRRGRRQFRLWIGDQVAVAHRSVCDREFKDAIEDHASAARSASVEAKDELIEIALQVRSSTDPWWVPSSRRLASEATRWTPGSSFAKIVSAGLRGPLTVRDGQCYYEQGSPFLSHASSRHPTGCRPEESHTRKQVGSRKESVPPGTLDRVWPETNPAESL